MLDKVDVAALNPKDLATWAKQIFAQKHSELTLKRQAERSSIVGPDAADNRLWDDATIRAWDMIEAEGINATWPAQSVDTRSGMTAEDYHIGHRMLTTLTDGLKGPAKPVSLRKSFEAATGQSAPSAIHVGQLMETYIRAMAHAHRSFAGLDSNRTDGFRAMLDATGADMINAANAIYASVTTDVPDEAQGESAQVVAPATPSVTSRSIAADKTVAQLTPDPALTAVVARLMAEKEADNLRAGTVAQYGSCIALFSKVTGVADVRGVTQSSASAFRDGLRRISTSYGKSLEDKNLTYDQLLEKAASLGKARVGLSPTTINRHLDHLRQVLDKADSEGIILPHKVDTSKLRLKEKTRDRDKRAVFRAEELAKVFRHSLWTGHASAARRHVNGPVITKDGQYWCPMIASVTGARLEEIAALTLPDFGTEDGIAFFVFDENELRDVKTEASRRRVPIHSALINAGFLLHVDTMKRRKLSAIFPDLAPRAGTKTKYGKKLGYNWRKSLECTLDGNPRALCFHSMRHFVNKTIRDMHDVPRLVRLNIVGQEAIDTNDRVYAEDTELPLLRDVVERLPALWV